MKCRDGPAVLRAAIFLSFCACLFMRADAEFKLPASVQRIEDNAFQNTSADNIILQDAVEYIGDYAFANMPNLSEITIPTTTSYIGPNSFAGNENRLVIAGAYDSYAMHWAAEHGIRYTCTDYTLFQSDNSPGFRLLSGFIGLAVVFLFMFKKNEEVLSYYSRSELQTLDYDFP